MSLPSLDGLMTYLVRTRLYCALSLPLDILKDETFTTDKGEVPADSMGSEDNCMAAVQVVQPLAVWTGDKQADASVQSPP
jgi:hypothetical protein